MTDVMQKISSQIWNAIQSGARGNGWELPWHKVGMIPTNAITEKPYRGSNIFTLSIAADYKGYGSNLWATYKQWESIGANVRKGEKATMGIFWDVKKYEKEDGTDFFRYFNRAFFLFNANQVDGFVPPTVTLNTVESLDNAEKVIDSTGAKIVYGGDRACYIPSMDIIKSPERNQYKSTVAMYSTLFHEIGHWTGHSSRLDRVLKTNRGTVDYGFEELIADMASAIVCQTLGITSELPADHVEYCAGWATRIKADEKFFFKAASLAQKAADYILQQ